MRDHTRDRSIVGAFVRSVATLAFVGGVVPMLLVGLARLRFGGGSPLHGVGSPTDWNLTVLSGPLGDQLLADLVIRFALVAGWIGVIVFVATVIDEAVHLVRHDGIPRPDIRGLSGTQRGARVVAAGLVAIVPLFSSSTTGGAEIALARAGSAPTPAAISRPVATVAPLAASASRNDPVEDEYEVRPGDSIFAIAERLAGPDPSDVATYASEIVDLNWGREMNDGRRFDNAAFIDTGWVLRLPPSGGDGALDARSPTGTDHVVQRGEMLSSIAAERLGDADRWVDIYEANAGVTFADGRTLDDSDVILPGWRLTIPAPLGDETVAVVDTAPVVEVSPVVEPSATADASDVPELVAWEVPAHAPDAQRPDTPVVALLDDAVSVESSALDQVVDEPPSDERADGAASASALGGAAMLSAGVLALLGVVRRRRLRGSGRATIVPSPTAGAQLLERRLRSNATGDRVDLAQRAIRTMATDLAMQHRRVAVVLVAGDGAVEVRTTGAVRVGSPWVGQGTTWRLSAVDAAVIEDTDDATPSPALVQLGVATDGRDVFVDLEGLEALHVGGAQADADAIVTALAATLAGSVPAEVTSLVGVGIPDGAFLHHRRYLAAIDTADALRLAAETLGSVASMVESTFELRCAGGAGDAWEPAVVFVGAESDPVDLPANRTGLAVVTAAGADGARARLAPTGESSWVLEPAGIELAPVGLSASDVAALAELTDPDVTGLTIEAPLPSDAAVAITPSTDDDTTVVVADGTPAEADRRHDLVVRLFGPVRVTDESGDAVRFERSKALELVAWMATHRERSTRSNARAAMWELDVRDATFSNVVSDARRALARAVEPPDGDEWVGRTMTDDLPLHDRVVTDADLIRVAAARAHGLAPAEVVELLTPVVELIQGLPFEGTTYLWPDSEGLTSNLVVLTTSVTAQLASAYLALDDVPGVFAATSTGLQVLPGHEELIGLRMQAHHRAGDLAGVRNEWQTYERVLNADPWSDGEPAAKLVDLRAALLRGGS